MYFDPRFKRLLWYLIGSTKGGVSRAKILDLLNSRPSNTNQIASELKLDYKTVAHHLDVLTKNIILLMEMQNSYESTHFIIIPRAQLSGLSSLSN